MSTRQNGGLVEDVLEFGTALGSLLVDAAEGLLTPQVLNPSVALSLTGNPIARAVDGLRLFLAGGNLWNSAEELLKKGEIFILVPAVAPLIDEPPRGLLPLPQMVANAYGLGDFPAVWALEGLGHDYADRFWQQGMVPHGILSPEVVKDLPPSSLPMLNAGIGLSMARMLYDGNALAGFPRGLRWDTPAEEIRRMVAEIVRLDRDNATPGYAGAAYENMGLATRLLRPTMVPAVDQAILEIAPEVRGYFWHGVGRMSYFWPVNFLPCSDWQVFQMARHEAPDEEALLNAWAGAAWGYALVTQQKPEIMADLLLQLNGEELAENGGFANGIASSMMLRFDTTPNAPFIEPFIQYQPPDPQVADLWQRLVRTPAETALHVYYPALKQGGLLGEIFQYHDLAALVARLPPPMPG